MAAPHTFSNELEKWILNNRRSSVFFIRMTPLSHSNMERGIQSSNSQIGQADRRFSTGFAIHKSNEALFILTSCYAFRDCYNANTMISVDQLEKLFNISVLCDHFESNYRGPDDGDDLRNYTTAVVHYVNTRKNLLILQVQISDILQNSEETCQMDHPVIKAAAVNPVPTDTVFVISWPPLRHLTSSSGEISSISRKYPAVDQKDLNGYNMSLIEIDITCAEDSTGAPAFDNNGCFIGLFHCKANSQSYFVDLITIKEVLHECLDLP